MSVFSAASTTQPITKIKTVMITTFSRDDLQRRGAGWYHGISGILGVCVPRKHKTESETNATTVTDEGLILMSANSPAGQKDEIAPRVEDHLVEVFHELSTPVFLYLRRIGLCPEEAEDVVQEVFLRLFQHLDSKKEQIHVRGWVFRVAHNLAIDQHRRRRRFTLKSPQEWIELSDTLQDRATSPEERLLEEEQIALLGRALGTLTSRQAQCLDLRMEELSYREIGDVLGVSAATVAGAMKLAILKLRELLAIAQLESITDSSKRNTQWIPS
jgi:RNA polymerase sigma-70 factor, ECF subfamily